MEELRNLNDLDRGIHKRWIWGTKDNYFRSCDYLQKINYSIQDLNAEIKNLSTPSMKDVIFVIALVDWICEAVKSIQEILDFVPGTIIELNKIAGEPIDVLVNGKYVAKGEVVVIEENFGIRITEIIK